MRARRRIAEQQHELLLDVGRDRVLPAVGFAVHLLPLEPDDVDEQSLGEPVAAHDGGGEAPALVGEVQAAVAVQLDVAVVAESRPMVSDTAAADRPSRSTRRARIGTTPSSSIARIDSRYSSVVSCISATGPG